MTFEMKDSDMDAAWIADMWAKNPCTKILDQNGTPNGNYRTGPLRLGFVNIFERGKPVPPATQGKFGSHLIFPIAADLAVLKGAATETALAKWPTAGQQGGPTLHTPFRQQSEKQNLSGYNPGGIFIVATADQQQPYCVDPRGAPITDKAKLYSGVWALAVIRPFDFDKGMKKGVGFGLQGVIVIADDRNLGGGGSNPLADMAGAQIDAASAAVPVNSLF